MWSFIKVLKLILATLALVARGIAAAGAAESCTSSQSTDTAQTLAFFKASEHDLLTQTSEGAIHIAPLQTDGKPEIYLSKYTVETVPDTMVQGLVFNSLTIKSDLPSTDAVDHKVVEKMFRALGAVHAATFTLVRLNVAGAEESADPPALGPGIDPPRLLKVHTKNLVLRSIGEASAGWVLARLDLSESELVVIHLYNAETITTLQFLDKANPKAVAGLYVWRAEVLASIECALLRRQAIQDVFELSGAAAPVSASPETLQAIATKPWDRLALTGELWSQVASKICHPFAVRYLTIAVEFVAELDSFWDARPEEKPSVNHLKLSLNNSHSKPKSAMKEDDLLEWSSACFMNTKTIMFVEPGPRITTHL
ncbi:hypothetical protein NEDG_01577 [Nematocida displodere]|uniref:Uncharacterized protein n=1 Tax=Nematocida displodere TaxID=1805483 RepID=A0A177EGS1_9MICR|nr:hypothetical protein NEDG_01577 [Nematocida displodere]